MNDYYNIVKDISSTVIPILVATIAMFSFWKAKKYKSVFDIENELKNESQQSDTENGFVNINSDVALSTNEKQFLLLKQYHSQGLTQSNISFWFSLIFAALGFVLIVTSILNIEKDKTFWTQTTSLISLISGIIIDSVSALFFVQSNKSRELMATFFDKLRTDRKIEESLKLSDEIPDEILKSKLKMILSLHFAEINTTDKIVSIIFKENDENNYEEIISK